MKSKFEKNILNNSLALIAIMFPAITSVSAYESNIFGLGQYLVDFINSTLLWLIFALATIFFLYNTMTYLTKPDKVKESGKYMLWGLIALTVMFTVFGIVNLFADTLNFSVGIPRFNISK